MLEKMKAVSNPLTIIALFAALAEVAGTISLKFLDPSLQKIFIWFVMGFPTLIVIMFFVVLILKREALYGPGDFREDKSFLDLSTNTKRAIELEAIEKALYKSTADINDAVKKVELISNEQKKELIEIVNNRLLPVQNVVEEAKENAENRLELKFMTNGRGRSHNGNLLLKTLLTTSVPLSHIDLQELHDDMSLEDVSYAIDYLCNKKLDIGEKELLFCDTVCLLEQL